MDTLGDFPILLFPEMIDILGWFEAQGTNLDIDVSNKGSGVHLTPELPLGNISLSSEKQVTEVAA